MVSLKLAFVLSNFIYRILGPTHLTIKQLASLFANIEVILNLTADPSVLSTHHQMFSSRLPRDTLIGRPLTSLPSPSILGVISTSRRLNLDDFVCLRHHNELESCTSFQRPGGCSRRFATFTINYMFILSSILFPLHRAYICIVSSRTQS